MKKLLVLGALMSLPMLAQAGDNGSYSKCVSASGRTELIIGTVGSALNPRTVELKIDKKSYGQAIIDEEVIERQKGNVVTYIEADHDGDTWVQITKKGGNKVSITGGLDPRSNKPIDKIIDLTCKEIYNPI